MDDINDSGLIPVGIPQQDEEASLPHAELPELLVITGMSGAGRTRAADTLEDLDWYVVDNLPPRLLRALARMMTPDGGVHRLAVVVDVRSRGSSPSSTSCTRAGSPTGSCSWTATTTTSSSATKASGAPTPSRGTAGSWTASRRSASF